MPEIDDAINESVERAGDGSRLNSAVAILVAITATFMALGNIKDGNIVQEMARDQAKYVDSWSFYQAKSIKQHLMVFGKEQTLLKLETDPALTSASRARYEKALKEYEAGAKKYETEKAEIQKEAEGYDKTYNDWNVHDDQFDMAEAFFSIAIALGGITSLTQKKWLFWFALGMGILGLIFNLAGFLGLSLHPDAIARIFGT